MGDFAIRCLEQLRGKGSDRVLDLRLSRHFNTSSIHDDHLDRFPDAADHYTGDLAVGLKALPCLEMGQELAIGLADGGWYASLNGYTASRYPDMARAVSALAVMIKNNIRDFSNAL